MLIDNHLLHSGPVVSYDPLTPFFFKKTRFASVPYPPWSQAVGFFRAFDLPVELPCDRPDPSPVCWSVGSLTLSTSPVFPGTVVLAVGGTSLRV